MKKRTKVKELMQGQRVIMVQRNLDSCRKAPHSSITTTNMNKSTKIKAPGALWTYYSTKRMVGFGVCDISI